MNPMNIMILEDDETEVSRFEIAIKATNDFNLSYTTNSVKDAVLYLQHHPIEGVIVDIELNRGIGGSGLDFLKEINDLYLEVRPIIFVTTRNESELVYNAAKALKTDLLFYKSKIDYSPAMILTQFNTLKPYLKKPRQNTGKSKIETEIERKKRIEEMITEELNLIGIPPNLKGSNYLYDAILFLVQSKDKDDCYYTKFLFDKYKVRKGGMSTSMQDAINAAWRNTPEDELLEHFTANIMYKKGTPTPTQFIHYYATKIKKRI